MDKYLPILSPIPGTNAMQADYGPAHARRQSDAETALTEVGFAARLVILTVFCPSRPAHRLAKVFRTHQGEMIAITQADHPDADIRRMRRDTELQVGRVKGIVTDVLRAPDDFDLEARCKCGGFTLDRQAIIDAIDRGRDTLVM